MWCTFMTIWILSGIIMCTLSVMSSRSTVCSACCVENQRTPLVCYLMTPDSLHLSSSQRSLFRSSHNCGHPADFKVQTIFTMHADFHTDTQMCAHEKTNDELLCSDEYHIFCILYGNVHWKCTINKIFCYEGFYLFLSYCWAHLTLQVVSTISPPGSFRNV